MPKEMCSARVTGKGLNFPRPHACQRSASVTRNGKPFCGQHDPSAIAARKDAGVKARMEEQAQRRRVFIAQQAGPDLLEKLKLARHYVNDAASAKAPKGSGPWKAHQLLIEINHLITKTEIMS